MIFLTILQLNIWPDFYDSVCDCCYNFFCCFWRVFLPNCIYQKFYSSSTFLACGYSNVALSLHRLSFFLLSSCTPCVLDSSQPLSIPPLIQCQELPHSSHSRNTTFHCAHSTFVRRPLGSLLPRLAQSSLWTPSAMAVSTAPPCVKTAVYYIMFVGINKSEQRLRAPGHHDDGSNMNASGFES